MRTATESNGREGSCRAFPCQLIEILFAKRILSNVAVSQTKIDPPCGVALAAEDCEALVLEQVDSDSLFALATSFLYNRRRELLRNRVAPPPLADAQATCDAASEENGFPDIRLDTVSAGAQAVYGDRCDDEAILCTPLRACALHVRLTNTNAVGVTFDASDSGEPLEHVVERYWGYFSGRYVMSIASFGQQIQALSGAVNESAAVIAELMRRVHNRVQQALRNVLVNRALVLRGEASEEARAALSALAEGLWIPLPAATAHRVLIGCCVVGTKLCSDKGYKMSYYAQLGGMTLTEVCRYERGVLDLLGYEHLFVGQEHLERLLESNPEDTSNFSPTPLLKPVARGLSFACSPPLKPRRGSSSDDDIPRVHRSGNASSYTDPCSPSDDCPSVDGMSVLEATFDRMASHHKTVALSPTSVGRFTITNTVTGSVRRSFAVPPPLPQQRDTPPLGRWATPPLCSPNTSEEGVPSPIGWSTPMTRPISESGTPPLATPSFVHSFQSDGGRQTGVSSVDDIRSDTSSVSGLLRAVRLLGDKGGYAETVDHNPSPYHS